MNLSALFGWMQAPSERDCIVEAERRGMSVPVWEDHGEQDWRVVFSRKDGTALLLVPSYFTDQHAYVCPSVGVATADGDVFAAGYGRIPLSDRHPYLYLGPLLDRFQAWDGEDALSELLDTLPPAR